MADWTEVDPNSLLPGSPWTSPLAQAAFENPVAIAEGAVDAPRVEAPAMAGSEAGENLLFGTGGTGVVFTSGRDAEIFIPEASFRATAECEVRVSAQYAVVAGASNFVFLRIYKNGSTVLTQSKTSFSWSTHTVDISLEPGDLVRVSIEGNEDDSITTTGGVRDVRYLVGDQRTVGGI